MRSLTENLVSASTVLGSANGCAIGAKLLVAALDRDRNAAANLAAWAERSHAQAPDRQAGGRVIKAPGGEGTDRAYSQPLRRKARYRTMQATAITARTSG